MVSALEQYFMYGFCAIQVLYNNKNNKYEEEKNSVWKIYKITLVQRAYKIFFLCWYVNFEIVINCDAWLRSSSEQCDKRLHFNCTLAEEMLHGVLHNHENVQDKEWSLTLIGWELFFCGDKESLPVYNPQSFKLSLIWVKSLFSDFVLLCLV